MTSTRVVVAGLGDSGLLTAIHLSRHTDVEVVGVSAKPALVSGQELGLRLARPDDWADDYHVAFHRFRRLDRVRTVHGTLTALDVAAREVSVEGPDGASTSEPYDVLVVSTGVSNGFWRRPGLQATSDVEADLREQHARLEAARSVIVIGGGAAAVSAALNLAIRWPDHRMDLYFPGERPLPLHHRRVWERLEARMTKHHVGLHAGHRAVVPDGFACDQITDEPVDWSTGQPASTADAVVWAIGRVRPNTSWLPPELLDADGYVRADQHLQVPEHPEIFTIGDVASTDPMRGSARNRADRLLAHNIRASVAGRPLRSYRPAHRRWGAVVGPQADGLEVFTPRGKAFRFPSWTVRTVVQPLFVRRGIYGGIRRS